MSDGKSGITCHGASLPLPRPARPGAPRGGVTEERPSALGYRPFVPRARRSVGTGAAADRGAWAAQPPAPRVVAGSGAGCWPGGGAEPPGGGGTAEPPGGGGFERAVAGGRAPGFRRLPRALGRWGPRPGKALAAAASPKARCARGPHTRGRRPHPLGYLAGFRTLPGSQVSPVKCALLCRGACAFEEEEPPLLLAPGLRFSSLGTPGWASGPVGRGLQAPRSAGHSARLCLAVRVPRRLALCSLHARILS